MNRAFLSAVCLAATCAASPAAAQQARFDDVVRNLRNPDAKVRMSALRLLREAQYPEAIVPMAPLVNDPVEQIQLEAIAAELSFFMVEKLPERKRIGFLVEMRNKGGAPGAFEMGPLAVWPKPAPPELIRELLKAVDDENGRIRIEAIHAVGVIGGRSLAPDAQATLVKALDHYDPAIRAATASVVGRLNVTSAGDALIKAVNDSNREVRYAAMRALGDIKEARAAQALTEQLTYYGKGEGAWSALDALARIAQPSSAGVFVTYLSHKDPSLRRAAAEGLGRIGDKSQVAELQAAAGNDPSTMVRAAMAFALQNMGFHYIARLADFLPEGGDVALQVQRYFIELGPSIEKDLLPRLLEPDEAIRARVAEVLGAIGGDQSLAVLETWKDKDRDVVEAAQRAVERIKMRRG